MKERNDSFDSAQNIFDVYFKDNSREVNQQLHEETIENTNNLFLVSNIYNIEIKRFSKNSDRMLSHELIEGVDLSNIIISGQIQLHELMNKIQVSANYCLQNHEIFMYMLEGKLYVNFGVFPLNENLTINLKEFVEEGSNFIKIKVKELNWSHCHLEMLKNTSLLLLDGPPRKLNQLSPPDSLEKQSSIKNFQKVGYIIKKVLALKNRKKQREMNKETFKFKNDRELTKKSIEDYFYQIKLGFKNGYNFNENCQQNMKHLREFNKKKQNKKEVVIEDKDLLFLDSL